MLWVNIGILTNLQTQTNLRKYVATTLLIIVLDGTLVQSGTVVHAYLDDSKGKLPLFTLKVVTNLYVLNSLLVIASYDSIKVFNWTANRFS